MIDDYPSNLHTIVSWRGERKRKSTHRFEPRPLEIDSPVTPMRQCSLTMNDGTVIEAHYQTKEQLCLTIEELMRLLETEG